MKKTILILLALISVLGINAQGRVSEICGVYFGASYEQAKRILSTKFGEPFTADTNKLQFNYKQYGGFNFSSIIFVFQRDGAASYLNACIMGSDCKTKEEAQRQCYQYYLRLSSKYNLESFTTNDGETAYSGGIAPRGDGDAICIDYVKYDTPTASGNWYFARIYYGPFQYVKEDF